MKPTAFILYLSVVACLFCVVIQTPWLCDRFAYTSRSQSSFNPSIAHHTRIHTGIAVPQSTRECFREMGAIVRGDVDNKRISLIFTGGDFSDGGETIGRVLREEQTPGSFFFTGEFYRNPANSLLIKGLMADGHYLGPHSDKHLLYCSWEDREKTLVTKQEFVEDIQNNYAVMARFGIDRKVSVYFIPPFEWYNAKIAEWAKELGLTLINFTPGTLSTSDYTTPEMANYKTTERIYSSIIDYEKASPYGLNGFMLLLHIGTHPDRIDKFYVRLADLIHYLKRRNYTMLRVDHLLEDCE